MSHSRQHIRAFHSVRGFSMVELMIAMAIGLVVTAGIGTVYIGGKQSYQMQNSLTALQENGRFGLTTLTQDLRRAGYYNGNADTASMGGSAPPVAAANSCNTGDSTWGRMIERQVFGLDDTNSPYDVGCIPDSEYIGSDVMVVRYASPVGVTDAEMAADPNRLYLRSTLFTGLVFKGVDRATNTIPDDPQRVSELVAQAYYVGNSTLQCQSVAVPTLFRQQLSANGTPEQLEIARGVERFQVQYGVGNAGSVTQYLDADNVTDWDQVVAVRVWLLLRADCPETGYTNTSSYTMGDQAAYAPADAYRRQLYSATTMLRNGG